MSVSLNIVSHAPSLDMYGEPDTSSAYSLSGHVSILLHTPYSLFERRRTTSFLLQSLKLTLEGQTEVLAPQFGYTSLRLCSITKDIAPSEPVEITNEGQEDTTCRWDIVFNIPIPGWLPASTVYGSHDIGIKYTLDATAVLVPTDDPTASSSWSLSSLCVPFRSHTKTLYATEEINLRRFIDTQFLDSTEVPEAVFLVNSKLATSGGEGLHIPQSVLSKIQVVACVPEYIDVKSGSVALTIRLRSQGLDDEHCQRLQLNAFTMDVVQREKCRFQPSDESRRRLPLPPDSEQPPNLPLRHGHRVGFLYEGLYAHTLKKDSGHLREVSLLHAHECGEYKLVGDCHIFANDAKSTNPSWYTLQTRIPVVSEPRCKSDEESEWIGAPRLRATSYSPLLTFRHEMRLSLYVVTISLGVRSCQRVAVFHYSSQICPCTSSSTGCFAFSTVRRPRSQMMQMPTSTPYTQTSALPAYSQLFDSNGDRKLDPTPLPLYTSRESPNSLELTSTVSAPPPEVQQSEPHDGKMEHEHLYDDDEDYSSTETTLYYRNYLTSFSLTFNSSSRICTLMFSPQLVCFHM
ncbi:hypothetical protein CPB85DRAFT_298788 [Mucidula mucida]|nr:hypothetical protein CPB85DRAFT_298788 [Mucidula mucida]